jgi:hypothetical protein
MVSPIMATMRLTKVLMDGDSGPAYSTPAPYIGRPSKASFYGIILGKEDVPLGRIWLNVTFGQPGNFRKEPLTFEVVDFPGVYHAL